MGELQVQEIEAIDDYDSSGIAWPWVAIAGACLLLVALLQIEGVIMLNESKWKFIDNR